MSELNLSWPNAKGRNPRGTNQPINLPAMSASNFATPALIQSIFGEALSKYTSSLLCKVCTDYSLDFKEVSARYMDSPEALSFFTTSQVQEVQKAPKAPKAPKNPKEEKRPCQGHTTKGQCKFAALPGSDLCGIHQRKADGVKPQKKPKESKSEVEKPQKKSKKSEGPKHTHELEEESEDCALCESHGNLVKPEFTEKAFDTSADIKAKLQSLLEEEDELASQMNDLSVSKPEAREHSKPAETEEKPKNSGFIRPPMRKKKGPAPTKKPEDVAGPSNPIMDTPSLRAKLQSILQEEDEEEDFDEEGVKSRLTARLSSVFDQEDEEIDLEQMCDSPHSQHVLREAWADMEDEE